ncbi:hypothetical protein [Mesorhizobium sp. M0085]|uniref:hypothetical protein n=1 Tax=Mesorhizobium sp. M0085 TaxID=2956872 RepID=UPI0033391B10
MLERSLAIIFQPLGRRERGVQTAGLQRFKEGRHHGFIDLHAADIEAIHPTPGDKDLAGTMVARRRGAAAIVGVQPSPAMATAANALQQRAALSGGATACSWALAWVCGWVLVAMRC